MVALAVQSLEGSGIGNIQTDEIIVGDIHILNDWKSLKRNFTETVFVDGKFHKPRATLKINRSDDIA